MERDSSEKKRNSIREEKMQQYQQDPPAAGMEDPYGAGAAPVLSVPVPAQQQGDPSAAGFGNFRSLFLENAHQVITYCCIYGSLGMCVALLGPTLLDLGCFTSYPLISTLSWIVFAQGLFSVVGSRFASSMVKLSSPHMVLLLDMVMLCATIALIPFCTHILLLFIVISVMGFFMGTVDVISNVCMMQLFEKRVGPFIQSLHFCYGLGAFLAPLIIEPYLLRYGCSHEEDEISAESGHGALSHHGIANDTLHVVINDTHHHGTQHGHHHGRHAPTHHHEMTPYEKQLMKESEADLEHAFWLMALLQIPSIILAASLVIRRRLAGLDESQASDQVYEIMNKGFEIKGIIKKLKGLDNGADYAQWSATDRQTNVVTTLASVMTFLADGLQAVFGSYIYTYAVTYVQGMDAANGAHLTATFWGFFAFGRFLSIGLATKIQSSTILLMNTVGAMLSVTMMVFFSHNHAAFYLGSGLFGLFLSSTFPTVTSLLGAYISVTPAITTQLVICAVLGETTLPVIIGHFFDNLGPESFLGTILMLSVVNFAVFLVLYKSGTSIVPPTGQPGPMELLFGALFVSGSAKGESAVLMTATENIQVYSRMDGGSSDNSVHEGSYTYESKRYNEMN